MPPAVLRCSRPSAEHAMRVDPPKWVCVPWRVHFLGLGAEGHQFLCSPPILTHEWPRPPRARLPQDFHSPLHVLQLLQKCPGFSEFEQHPGYTPSLSSKSGCGASVDFNSVNDPIASEAAWPMTLSRPLAPRKPRSS